MIHTLPNNYYAVQVKKDARGFQLNKNSLIYLYGVGGVNKVRERWLPEGSYQIVGMADMITEEQAGEIAEKVEGLVRLKPYKDYEFNLSTCWTAKESFDSLLASLSIEASNTLILKKV